MAKASVQWQLCNLCAPIALELLSISLLGGARPLYYYYYYQSTGPGVQYIANISVKLYITEAFPIKVLDFLPSFLPFFSLFPLFFLFFLSPPPSFFLFLFSFFSLFSAWKHQKIADFLTDFRPRPTSCCCSWLRALVTISSTKME